MPTQDPRKAAEQAARLALTDRINAVGALGQAAAQRATAGEEPTRAAAKAADLLAAARAEGQRLRDEARDAIATADGLYATAHADAVAAGWSAKELKALGYPAPATRRQRTPAPAGAPSDVDTGPQVRDSDTDR